MTIFFGTAFAFLIVVGAQRTEKESVMQLGFGTGPRFSSGGPINPSSPFASKDLELTEIDSLLSNGDIDKATATKLTVEWAERTDNGHLLAKILGALLG